ncbi:hypothetical protein NRK67_17305 (plasmid) [Fusobacteria bacterium ZRK30]|nr:hypothetical protein NRK67_17305 [Fusobacteria bacterium ZRK30]
MKKILISLFLMVSTISFSWQYDKQFRYEYEKNVQMLSETVSSNNLNDKFIIFGMHDNDYLSIGLSGNYQTDSIFSVKIYVDDKIVETVRMVAGNKNMLVGIASKKIVNSFRNGNTAILAYTHNQGSSVIKVNLNGFSNGFNKMKNIRYYH